MLKGMMTGLLLVATGTAANADYRNSVDEDQCWDAKNSMGDNCLSRIDAKREGARLQVKFTNRCSQRIYAQVCLERTSMRDDCGASGIRPGESFSYYTHKSTGRYKSQAIGSADAAKDWVCSKKRTGGWW